MERFLASPRWGLPSLIRNVIYIIKENRTYDQALGDLPQGDGDGSLVLFGREVTPNHHALAETLVLMRKLPRQVDTSKIDSEGVSGLGRNVSGGTRPRLSWGRSVL